jgi:hypothetical protein
VVAGRRFKRDVWVLWTSPDGSGGEGGELKVELLPLTMELGLAVKLTVGGEVAAATETVVDWTALPPGPVQLSV